MRYVLGYGLLAICISLGGSFAGAGENAVTVFTTRPNATDKEVFRDFEAETGIAVRVVEGKAGELIDQLAQAEGAPEADLFMTVDGGILEQAKRKGIFGTTNSPVLGERVPAGLRDKDNAWVGVTTRARVIVYDKERVSPSDLSSYLALAEPKWKGRVLIRSSGNLYNQSLVASFIEVYGAEEAKKWVDGIASNLAREPKGGDRDQAKGVAEGVGDVAVMNSYYLGQMLKSDDPAEVAAAKSLGVFFPDQDSAGTHINICGFGLVKNAPNAGAAVKLVEYLLSVPAQEKLSLGNSEFPVNPKAAKAPLLAGWGSFAPQKIDFASLYEFKTQAKAMLEASGWK